MPNRRLAPLICCSLVLLLASCATNKPAGTNADTSISRLPPPPPAADNTRAGRATAAASVPDVPPEASRIFNGTSQFIKGQLPGGGLPPPAAAAAAASSATVTLNFEAADLREVVRNILGDILGESYTIDPAVGGTVTIRTSSGVPRDTLTATLEMLLRMNGAAMVKEGAVWKIVPSATVQKGNVTPQLGNSSRALPPGYSVQIVPLKYVGTRQMMSILEPFVKDATTVRPDDLRNMLIVSGTELELRHLLGTIDTFDVNWMSGMSVGIFTLESADLKSVMTDFDKVMGDKDKGPLAGVMRIVPIERLNAILVITTQPQYLEEAKKWIERLDRGGEGAGVRFYVYHVQNSRADHIAPLLQQAFTGRAAPAAAPSAPTLSPGTPAGTIVNPPSYAPQLSVPVQIPTQIIQQQAAPSSNSAPAPGSIAANIAAAAGRGTTTDGIVRNLQAVADKDNNTIIFVATPTEYAIIESALKKLDIPTRQVLIDCTIAEVLLTDEFSLGVQWYFKNAAPSGNGAGGLFASGTTPGDVFNPSSAVSTALGVGLAPVVPGFNYLIAGLFPGGVRAAINALETSDKTKVISNPQVMALDNQKATIKVGNRIPINQQTLVGGTTNAVTTTSQYIDTGVLLQVTPHINAGGLVELDISIEVSVPGTSSDPTLAPPINTRSEQTLITVQSGNTMVMGGLILDTRDSNSAGLPLLAKLPLIGGLFGQQTTTGNRTELVLFITPRVVESDTDEREIMDDLRRRMERLEDQFPPRKPAPPAVPANPDAANDAAPAKPVSP